MLQIKKLGEWCELTIPHKWSGFSIEYILKEIWKAPKKQIHLMRMGKQIKVNGNDMNWNAALHAGDRLQLKLFLKEDYGVIPSYHKIEVICEDDHFIVFNKPENMDTHPNSPEQTNTLANGAAFYLQEKGELRKIKHVHRLDRDTTGCTLFAKHPLAGSLLDKLLEERSIKRTYLALVHGKLEMKKGTIRESIGRDRHHAVRRRVSPKGQAAITHYEVIDFYPKENLSLIKCLLDTGRTHQIRVHLSHLGHPLAGDVLYGGKPIFPRQALHAAKLAFTHPFSEEEIICYANVDNKDLRAYFKDWPRNI